MVKNIILYVDVIENGHLRKHMVIISSKTTSAGHTTDQLYNMGEGMNKHPGKTGAILVILICFLISGLYTDILAISAENTDRFTLGWQAYESGKYKEAREVWESLAKNGDDRAKVNLGIMYDCGYGVEEDPVQAAHWYREAADQGNCSAQYNLAVLYATGRGVSCDMQQAAQWYCKAAQQGFGVAQYDLGMLFASGQGVPKDDNTAIQWLYTSGITSLKEEDTDGVLRAAKAINKFSPGHPLGEELNEKLRATGNTSHIASAPELFSGASIGTAWPIASGYVVTSNHVVSDTDSVTLVDASGREISARVIIRQENRDFALLEVDDPSSLPPAIPLARSQERLGASIFTIGFPRIDVMGKTPKLSIGVISSVNGFYDDPGSYQTTVPIQPGNSGGPVLNFKGEAVGVVTSMLGIRDEATGSINMLQNSSRVTKIDPMKDMLARLPKKDGVVRELPRDKDSLEDLADRIQKSVLIVVAR